jgi:calcineurin-like phosphoesterase family protein
MNNIERFVISDTHFNHQNIISYTERNFETVSQMNNTIITNWNNTVGKYDKVFHLGDFCLANRETTEQICRSLKGYKILILGNHDRKIQFYYDIGFNEVYKYPIFYDGVLLSHQPIFTGIVNVHGHTHNIKYDTGYNFCASVENINYTPILFEKISKGEYQ